ncbi:hypothetical protein I5U05_014205 [Stenotrophomonas maltophilia]|jgi:hypothetical protein|uniref:Oligopeptide ABC transporter, permease protein n=1 Tax=Ralstonia insidiosa TaxID=190721 RepID=A0AAC9FR99_9RALS|nr:MULTISPECIES: hypothetical protein [Pseudomonadota]MBH1608637.1 hypothetical protein [Stenotrophomonas maltophilia]MCL6470856.1 hypothetical protein [Ralstonia sp.]ANH72665.1 putative oligopeptide ABC transporter, permease protein [Ralstonia insidiosa]KWR78351.1 hypothetical protein RN01_23055 [Cupriavidus sp. SHE]MBH1726007.1 hypothetical protein [Stenotrophomonas maltophilia]
MSIGISDLAHSVRKNSAAQGPSVPLGHSQQLVVAALGYKTFAAYQAAQATSQEPAHLADVHHVVLDVDRLDQRASELGVATTPDQLHALLDTAFGERAPHIRLHASYAAFEDFLRQHVDQTVTEDSDVNSEMANANYDGIDEVYFDFEVAFDDVAVGGALDIELAGHVGLGIDTERPYAGHIVNVEGVLSVVRLGQHCFGSVDCQVTKADLDTDWGDDDHEDGPPVRSTSQAYAELLGLELHEVGDLVDVEAEPRDGNSGEMIYSYLLDFTDAASPEIAQKILRRHGSLRIEVGPSFFENLRSDDWPR